LIVNLIELAMMKRQHHCFLFLHLSRMVPGATRRARHPDSLAANKAIETGRWWDGGAGRSCMGCAFGDAFATSSSLRVTRNPHESVGGVHLFGESGGIAHSRRKCVVGSTVDFQRRSLASFIVAV